MPVKSYFVASLAFVLVALASPYAGAAPYRVTALESVTFSDLTNYYVRGFNDSAQMTCRTRVPVPAPFYSTYHATRHDDDVAVDLGTIGGSYATGGYFSSYANDINNAGVVVGRSFKDAGPYLSGVRDAFFIGMGEEMQALPRLQHGGEANAVNDDNMVAGVSFNDAAGNHYRAVTWSDTSGSWQLTDLGVIGDDTDSYAIDVNNNGQVLGTSYEYTVGVPGITDNKVVIWEEGETPIIISTTDYAPVQINDLEQVIFFGGRVWTQSGGFVETGLVNANSINNHGQVVGKTATQAAIWKNGTLTALEELLPAGSSIMLTNARHINDLGQILAQGYIAGTTEAYAYLLTPVSPGDHNSDGKVDGADLAAWQQHYDPTGTNSATNTWERGDWDEDGKIDGADLGLWQQNYDPIGSVAASGLPPVSASSIIPEPSSLVLFAMAASALAAGYRTREGR